MVVLSNLKHFDINTNKVEEKTGKLFVRTLYLVTMNGILVDCFLTNLSVIRKYVIDENGKYDFSRSIVVHLCSRIFLVTIIQRK